MAGQEKHIRDVLVEHCYFGNNQRFGIRLSHSGGNQGVGNDSLNRNINILIRNNEFYYNGGTGVLPNRTYNCLIENNIFDHPGASTDPRMPGRGSSIWNINCINTIMQYNMCLSTRGYLDSYGIHIDVRNENTFVQYNYMDDCEGGFVEILPGNKNAVYRFNVSVNSGWRKNPTWTDSNLSIWMNANRWGEPEDFAPGDSLFVYNNTVVVDKLFTTAISMDGKYIHVYNNIWTSTNGAGVGSQKVKLWNNGTPHFISNNLFEGTVARDFIDLDANPQIGPALFDSLGVNGDEYHLEYGSPALDNGAARRGPVVPGAGMGIFRDISAWPEVDFYGNRIDPIILCDTVSTRDTIVNSTVGLEELAKENHWLVFPQMAQSRIMIRNEADITGPLSISLVNLKGQQVQRINVSTLLRGEEYYIKLDPSTPNGIYVPGIQSRAETHARRIVLYR